MPWKPTIVCSPFLTLVTDANVLKKTSHFAKAAFNAAISAEDLLGLRRKSAPRDVFRVLGALGLVATGPERRRRGRYV